jgi:hypothetical protein
VQQKKWPLATTFGDHNPDSPLLELKSLQSINQSPHAYLARVGAENAMTNVTRFVVFAASRESIDRPEVVSGFS